MYNYDDLSDWQDDNIEELAVDFVDWLEAQRSKSYETLEDGKKRLTKFGHALGLWEDFVLARFDSDQQSYADAIYEAWKDEQ